MTRVSPVSVAPKNAEDCRYRLAGRGLYGMKAPKSSGRNGSKRMHFWHGRAEQRAWKPARDLPRDAGLDDRIVAAYAKRTETF